MPRAPREPSVAFAGLSDGVEGGCGTFAVAGDRFELHLPLGAKLEPDDLPLSEWEPIPMLLGHRFNPEG